jgi:endonuclease-3
MKNDKARIILNILKKEYPDAKTELIHSNPFELLIATILSAQSTDVTINRITPALFAKYPTPEKLSNAELKDVEKIIKSSGFYKVKAKNIIEASKIICEEFGGKVPDNMEKLLRLKGVARKTANVVLSNAFGKNEGVVVDTHVKRLAYRIGLSDETDPVKIEKELMDLFERKNWGLISNLLIFHGRRVCNAKKPKCQECAIARYCDKRI